MITSSYENRNLVDSYIRIVTCEDATHASIRHTSRLSNNWPCELFPTFDLSTSLNTNYFSRGVCGHRQPSHRIWTLRSRATCRRSADGRTRRPSQRDSVPREGRASNKQRRNKRVQVVWESTRRTLHARQYRSARLCPMNKTSAFLGSFRGTRVGVVKAVTWQHK